MMLVRLFMTLGGFFFVDILSSRPGSGARSQICEGLLQVRGVQYSTGFDRVYLTVYFRRALCHLQTLRYQQAVSDFKKVLVLEPQNDTVRGQMVATQKLIRKIEFEKVISQTLAPLEES
jgi:hypothetical protein